MRHTVMLYLTEEDLLRDFRDAGIEIVNISMFQIQPHRAILDADHAIFTNTKTLHSKIIKDRYGDAGRGLIRIIESQLKLA